MKRERELELQQKSNAMSNLINRLMILSIGISLVTCVYLAYLLFFPVNVITPNHQPYRIITKKVTIGGNLIYEVDACKHKPLKGEITRVFVGTVRYPSTTSPGTVRVGCSKTWVNVPVPNYIPTGKYRLDIDATYKINPLRNYTYNWSTEEFIVENPILEKVKEL